MFHEILSSKSHPLGVLILPHLLRFRVFAVGELQLQTLGLAAKANSARETCRQWND